MGDFLSILFGSVGDNAVIMIFAVLTAAALAVSVYLGFIIKKSFEPDNGVPLQKKIYNWLQVMYTLTVALISIFPLLGMLGTVISLVTIDMNAEAALVQNNFFFALTSTAWGIIWSVIFKVVNSFFQSFVEDQLERAKQMLTDGGEKK